MEKGNADLGGLLREARSRKGLSQEEAAKRIHVSLRHYGNWERGKNTPGGGYLRSISMTLDIDPDELARAAGRHDLPVDVQAQEARHQAETAQADVATLTEQVTDLRAEVARLQGLVRAYEPPSEDELASIIDVIVAARLAEAAATTDASPPHAASPAERSAKSA